MSKFVISGCNNSTILLKKCNYLILGSHQTHDKVLPNMKTNLSYVGGKNILN